MMSDATANLAVMAVTLAGWIGIFFAVLKLDRKVRKLEDR
jgi:hypothetical protein